MTLSASPFLKEPLCFSWRFTKSCDEREKKLEDAGLAKRQGKSLKCESQRTANNRNRETNS